MLNMQLQKQHYMGKLLQNKGGCKKYSFIRKSTCLISADERVMYARERMSPEPRCHFGKMLQLSHLEGDLSSLNYFQSVILKKWILLSTLLIFQTALAKMVILLFKNQPVVINLRAAEHLRSLLIVITRKSNPTWQLCSIWYPYSAA